MEIEPKGPRWALSGLFCSLDGAVAGGSEPPDLADSKREHPIRLCLDHIRLPSEQQRKGRQEDYPSDFLNRSKALCFFFFPLDTAERAAAEQSLLFESKMATHSAYCFPVWATGSGLGPFFPYFSWDYFCTKTGAGMRNACLRWPVSAAFVLGTPSTSQVSFLAQQGRGRRCCGT